jgi:hypothetical protein
MPLLRFEDTVVDTRWGIFFYMYDPDTPPRPNILVSCLVTSTALEFLMADGVTERGPIFDQNRALFERTASAQYDAGVRQRIVITAGDLKQMQLAPAID